MNRKQTATRTRVVILLTSLLIASCGSSGSDSISESESSSGEQTEQPVQSSSETQGSGTVTIGAETFTFDLRCVFGEENTTNEEASISINGQPSGTTPSDIGMSFTEQWGIDFSTGKISKDAPVYHSLTIYRDAGRTLLFEYLSITRDPNVTKPLDVNGKTVSGPADFVAGDSEDPFASTPGEVTLNCE